MGVRAEAYEVAGYGARTDEPGSPAPEDRVVGDEVAEEAVEEEEAVEDAEEVEGAEGLACASRLWCCG